MVDIGPLFCCYRGGIIGGNAVGRLFQEVGTDAVCESEWL